MSENLLEIKDLQIHYEVDKTIVHAVNGISLTLKRGEILGLVGETGAGKTTTALSIMRLLPKYSSRIAGGSIFFDGIDITQAGEKQMQKIRGNRISMIFQDPMTSLSPVARVGKQVSEVIKLHNPKMSKQEVESSLERILSMVGIPPERKTDYPHQFSGGMKQRIMIAIAIACNPDLLIADEPTTALDVTIQAQVIRMMRQLQESLNSSVILITHDLGLVANFCDKVAIMYAGEIVESGTLEDLFDKSRPHHPYTLGLFNSIPNLEKEEARLKPIPGLMPDPSRLPDGCKFHPRCAQCTERCYTQMPRVYEQGTHRVACHMYEGGKEDHG